MSMKHKGSSSRVAHKPRHFPHSPSTIRAIDKGDGTSWLQCCPSLCPSRHAATGIIGFKSKTTNTQVLYLSYTDLCFLGKQKCIALLTQCLLVTRLCFQHSIPVRTPHMIITTKPSTTLFFSKNITVNRAERARLLRATDFYEDDMKKVTTKSMDGTPLDIARQLRKQPFVTVSESWNFPDSN
jgi:hypothetical protein